MRRLIVGATLYATVGAAQMPRYGVTVTTEKNVDFTKFATYSWTKGQPSHDKTIDAQVMAAVDRELGALGMRRTASGSGDVLATYYSLSRTDVDIKAKADASGRLPQYWVGTLVVALLEPSSSRRLLKMRIDQPIETDRTALEASINSAVAALFAKYPLRAR